MNAIRLLLIAALTSQLAAAATAQVLEPNPAPTVIMAVPYTITKAGFYQLGANLVSTANTGTLITINADNVTIDFNGHSLTGPADPSSSLVGVYATEHNNLTVQNGKVAFCEIGIYFNGTNGAATNNINQRVLNMIVTHCFYVGIDLNTTNNADVLNSRICFIGGSKNASDGIGVYAQGNGIKIANNELYSVVSGAYQPNPETPGSGYGIDVGSGVFAIGNTISNCQFSIYGGKYANNFTLPTNAPVGGMDAGGNN